MDCLEATYDINRRLAGCSESTPGRRSMSTRCNRLSQQYKKFLLRQSRKFRFKTGHIGGMSEQALRYLSVPSNLLKTGALTSLNTAGHSPATVGHAVRQQWPTA
jgi:hypothetical protein